jgi:transporter family-2 protein
MNGKLNKHMVNPWLASVISLALIISLVVDHFGSFRMDQHPITPLRALGGVLLIGGVTLIAKF